MNANTLLPTLILITAPFAWVANARAQSINVDLGKHVWAFGDAEASVNKGVLTASGINELGADGLAADVVSATGGRGAVSWHIDFSDPLDAFLPEGSSLNLDAVAVRDGGWASTPASIQRIEGGLYFSGSFAPDQLLAADVLDRDGNVVYTAENIPAGALATVYIPPRDGTIVVIRWIVIRAQNTVCKWEFDFSRSPYLGLPFIDSATGEIAAEGTTLVIREMVPGNGAVIVNATISGRALDPFRISGMTMDLAPIVCPADFNADGAVNSQDLFDFLGVFFEAAPAADFNGDAVVNSQDFFDFLSAFFAGC